MVHTLSSQTATAIHGPRWRTPIKCCKCYNYIFWFLFDVCTTNPFILRKECSSLNIRNVKTFRAELAKELIGDYNSSERSGRAIITATAKRFCQSHFPTRGSDQVHRRHYCSTYRKERRATVWLCRDCNLFLCHNGKEQDLLLYVPFPPWSHLWGVIPDSGWYHLSQSCLHISYTILYIFMWHYTKSSIVAYYLPQLRLRM